MLTNELPMVDVLRLKALESHRLWVRFSDGSEGVRDFSDILAEGGFACCSTTVTYCSILRWRGR